MLFLCLFLYHSWFPSRLPLPVSAPAVLSAQISFQIFSCFIFQAWDQMSPLQRTSMHTPSQLFSIMSLFNFCYCLCFLIWSWSFACLLISFLSSPHYYQFILSSTGSPAQRTVPCTRRAFSKKTMLNEWMSLSFSQQPFIDCWTTN